MLRVVVVGAGVAGSVIARGLLRVPNVETTVVEQLPENGYVTAGNGLNIGPNALKVARDVLPAMATDLRRSSLAWSRWRASLATGSLLYDIPLREVADGPGIRIRWSQLYQILREPIRPITWFNRRCIGVELHGASKVRVTLERTTDSTRETIEGIDLLIVGEGRYSRIRELCCGSPAIRHLGVANFRVLIDDHGTSQIDDLEEWYNGPNRILAFRLPDGKVYASGNFPIEPGCEIDEGKKTVQALRQTYLASAREVDRRYAFLVEACCAQIDQLHWSRAQEIGTRFRDDSGRVLFVGDSAHAMAPTLGQGATQAVEDGCRFLSLFGEVSDGCFSTPALTFAYDQLRRERIEFVKNLSWDASEPLLAGSDPVVSNRKKSGLDYRAKLRRLYLQDASINGRRTRNVHSTSRNCNPNSRSNWHEK
jgi:salicylate hydroxylase